MNDEIKETLKYLKDEKLYSIINGIKQKMLYQNETDELLDYITNLQEENERLKEQISNSLKLCEELIKEKDKLYNHLCLEMRKDDKKIINKAIEYIKGFENKFKGYAVFPDKRFLDLEELLSILNGGDEE